MIKQTLSKTWKFIWKDDSIWSWIVSLAIAFIIVKFIFFPLLSLILGSSMPLVVVESESMHHPGSFIGNAIGLEDNFEMWWIQRGSWYLIDGITKNEALTWPLKTGLEMGDIVVVSGYSTLEIGDIIVFEAGQKRPLIHRIIAIKTDDNQTYYSTKGDNNPQQLSSEKKISENDVIGKAVLRVPKLGWLKLGFIRFFQAFG